METDEAAERITLEIICFGTQNLFPENAQPILNAAQAGWGLPKI